MQGPAFANVSRTRVTDFFTVNRVTPSLDLAETNGALEVRLDIQAWKPKTSIFKSTQMCSPSVANGKRSVRKREKPTIVSSDAWAVFYRSVTLPCPVKEDAVDAQYKNGILTIKLPKTEEGPRLGRLPSRVRSPERDLASDCARRHAQSAWRISDAGPRERRNP